MINAQLFYKDSTNIIYSLSDNQIGRYFLNVPVTQYNNFMVFLKLKKEDNTKKGIDENSSNEQLKRKEFLNEIKKANEFIKSLNSNMVYSRVNHLKELPENELEDVLNENKPFDMNRYKEIIKNIEEIINENFRLMTSSNIKKESIEQTILLISQKEEDKDFIEWLKTNLTSDYSNKNLEDLRMEYKQQRIQLNIEEYQEVQNNNKKFIIGKNSKGEMFTVEFPSQYNMLQIFEMELKTVDKTKLVNLDGKIVTTILFDKIILDLPSKRINGPTIEEQKTLNPTGNQEPTIVVTQNIPSNNEQVMTTQETPIVDPQNIPSNNKKIPRRILVPSNVNGNGFIKVGTIILFGLSFILTIISLILLIAS